MKNNYTCNCNHYDFSSKKFDYWEDKIITSDELLITDYLKNNLKINNKKLLHIGIGNSYVYERLKLNNTIYGITISNKEIEKAHSFKDKNYKVYYCDKISKEFKIIFKENKFDLIIDNNLKSYSCCANSFNFQFDNMVNLLRPCGSIITSRNGMNWFKNLKPKLTFNFKKFFHYRIKEIDGDNKNIFSIEEAKSLSRQLSLELFYNDQICIFKKK